MEARAAAVVRDALDDASQEAMSALKAFAAEPGGAAAALAQLAADAERSVPRALQLCATLVPTAAGAPCAERLKEA